MERLYLDTNVLFPMTLMDLMLSMAEDFHHDILWTDFLLEEWERVIVREKRRTTEQAQAITDAIRQAFPDGRVAPAAYEPLVDSVPGSDDDDRIHGAAAVAGGATAIITENVRHFDATFFASHGVVVGRAEDYLLGRLEAAPDLVIGTVRRLLALKTQQPWTPEEYLDRLDRAGAPRFADALRHLLR